MPNSFIKINVRDDSDPAGARPEDTAILLNLDHVMFLQPMFDSNITGNGKPSHYHMHLQGSRTFYISVDAFKRIEQRALNS